MIEKNGLVIVVLYNESMNDEKLSVLCKQVWQQLGTVMDPELDIDIVSLGLIYDVEVSGEEIRIIMTLTTPGCPLAPVIDRMIKEAVSAIEGVETSQVVTELVWDPPWVSDLMTEEARLQLGIL